MRRRTPLQSLFALVIALSVLCAAPASALVAPPGDTACALENADERSCAHPNQNTADKSAHGEVDKLSGTPPVPITRASRWWLHGAAAEQDRRVCAEWLKSPGRDPPKTIRFCSFLI